MARYLPCILVIAIYCLYTFFISQEVEKDEYIPNTNQYFNVVFRPSATVVEINKIKFVDCVAYKISFDGEYFGIFLDDDIIYLPAKNPKENHQLSITCTDADDQDKEEQTWEITPRGTIYDE